MCSRACNGLWCSNAAVRIERRITTNVFRYNIKVVVLIRSWAVWPQDQHQQQHQLLQLLCLASQVVSEIEVTYQSFAKHQVNMKTCASFTSASSQIKKARLLRGKTICFSLRNSRFGSALAKSHRLHTSTTQTMPSWHSEWCALPAPWDARLGVFQSPFSDPLTLSLSFLVKRNMTLFLRSNSRDKRNIMTHTGHMGSDCGITSSAKPPLQGQDHREKSKTTPKSHRSMGWCRALVLAEHFLQFDVLEGSMTPSGAPVAFRRCKCPASASGCSGALPGLNVSRN